MIHGDEVGGTGKDGASVFDQATIAALIQRERAARDAADWEQMATLYHPQSSIDVAWFQGSGQEFVQATKKNWRTDAINFHELGVAVVDICADRAIAETACTLHGFFSLHGVAVTLTGYVRLLWRAQRFEGTWLIAGLRSLYIRDLLKPCNGSDRLDLDEEELCRYRPSYRYLTHTLKVLGRNPRHDLPGMDLSETVAAVREAEQVWLRRL